jgi:cutinase
MLWYTFLNLFPIAPLIESHKVFFARGTTEPPPIGTVAGPPLQSALKKALGGKSLSFQGVDYPADIPGFLEGGDAQGSKDMAADVSLL